MLTVGHGAPRTSRHTPSFDPNSITTRETQVPPEANCGVRACHAVASRCYAKACRIVSNSRRRVSPPYPISKERRESRSPVPALLLRVACTPLNRPGGMLSALKRVRSVRVRCSHGLAIGACRWHGGAAVGRGEGAKRLCSSGGPSPRPTAAGLADTQESARRHG